MVQYRLSRAVAAALTAREDIAQQYRPGDLLPAVVLSVKAGRADLHVFLHGPGTAYIPNVPEHYAAEGSWTAVPGR